MSQRRLRGRREDQRGAVALFMVAVLTLMMFSSAFIVDLGLQRVARSDMQAIADLVALDLARQLDGRSVAALTPVLDEALAESLDRNEGAIGEDPDLTYEMGAMGNDGFVAMSSGVPTAVRVVARTEVSFAFAAVTGAESGEAGRTAAAEASSTACFRLGTFVAAIRAGDSTVLAPLNDLFGVNLDLVGYRGLADADVRLEQLAATSVFGSPEELLSSSITYSDLVVATIEALSNEGGNAVALQALGTILNSNVTSSVGFISLSDVLHVAPTDKAAMQVDLDVLDIVGSARLADGQHFLGIPNIQAQVPGVGFQFTGGIYLVSAAELACGVPNSIDATADTAQLNGTVGVTFTNMPSLNVAGLGTLQTPKGTGVLEVRSGSGTGRLVAPPAVHCGEGTALDPTTMSVDVTTGLASYQLRSDVSVEADVRLADLLGLGLTSVLTNLLGNILLLGNRISLEVEVELRVGMDAGAGSGRADLRIPPNDETPISTGSSMHLDPALIVPTVKSVKLNGKSAQLSAVTAVTNLIVQAMVSTSKGFVEKTLTPLVDNINQQFIGPAARMIGLRLAGADVYAVGATCARPRLVG